MEQGKVGGFTPRLEEYVSLWTGLSIWRYGPYEIRKRILGGWWVIEKDGGGYRVQRRVKTFKEAKSLADRMYEEEKDIFLETEYRRSEKVCGIKSDIFSPCSNCGRNILELGYKGKSVRGNPIHTAFCACGNNIYAYSFIALKRKWNSQCNRSV